MDTLTSRSVMVIARLVGPPPLPMAPMAAAAAAAGGYGNAAAAAAAAAPAAEGAKPGRPAHERPTPPACSSVAWIVWNLSCSRSTCREGGFGVAAAGRAGPGGNGKVGAAAQWVAGAGQGGCPLERRAG